MGPNRLEMFSDGVIAIAITLLVLDLHVPEAAGAELGPQLCAQWPAYAAYVTSFATIGIMWVNHHVIFTTVARVDRATLFLNLLLLFGIATLPFTTSLAATYLTAGAGADLAVALYSGWLALIAATFALILDHLGRRWDLLRPGTTRAQNRGARQRALAGVVAYVAAALMAALSPIVSLAMCLMMALYFIVAGRQLAPAL